MPKDILQLASVRVGLILRAAADCNKFLETNLYLCLVRTLKLRRIMKNVGFVKVAAAVPEVKVADCSWNAVRIQTLMTAAEEQGVKVVVFPELSITGYSCGDLFQQNLLLEAAEAALRDILMHSRNLKQIAIVGLPVGHGGAVYNAAAVVHSGRILGVVAKTFLPNYREFYEQRWFVAAPLRPVEINLCGGRVLLGQNLLFESADLTFGIEICEDLWASITPGTQQALQGAEVIFNLSADNETMGKHSYLRSLIADRSATALAGYVFASCGFGESTTDVVFGGNGLIYEQGTLLAEGRRFSLEEQLVVSEMDVERLRFERRVNTTFAATGQRMPLVPVQRIAVGDVPCEEIELSRTFDPLPFVPKGQALDACCEEITSIQVLGLVKRLKHIGAKTVVIGISGGLDSTLALLICARAFDRLALPRAGIVGITMPGFGTTDRTYRNALALMESLGITRREISIKAACLQHFADIGHEPSNHDVTYENTQARERTQVLMDVANQVNGIVVGTGDLSELALGWATYNGDHMSMYGVNAGVAKTLVKHLVAWMARNTGDERTRLVLFDVVDTPISPELTPADEQGNIQQKTEDLVGPYELHDFFLYHFLRFGSRPAKLYALAQHAFADGYEPEEIKKWLHTFFRRFFSQQFKRSCLPDGPKVDSLSLSPRGDWRMPSDASVAVWLREIESL